MSHSYFASNTPAELAKRIEALEGLVGERDARIAALEKTLVVVESKLASEGTCSK